MSAVRKRGVAKALVCAGAGLHTMNAIAQEAAQVEAVGEEGREHGRQQPLYTVVTIVSKL